MKKIGELRGDLKVFEDEKKYKFLFKTESLSEYRNNFYRLHFENEEVRIPIGESTFCKSNFEDTHVFVEHEILTGRLILNRVLKKNPIVVEFSDDIDISDIISLNPVHSNLLNSEEVYKNGSKIFIENAVLGNEYNLEIRLENNKKEDADVVNVNGIPTDVDEIDLTTFGKDIKVEIPEETASSIGRIKVYHYKNEPSINTLNTVKNVCEYDVYIPIPNKIPAKGAISKENYSIEYNPQITGYRSSVIDDFEDYPECVEFEVEELSNKDIISVSKPSWFIGSAELNDKEVKLGENDYKLNPNTAFSVSACPKDNKTFSNRSGSKVSGGDEISIIENLSKFDLDIYLKSYEGDQKILQVIQDDYEHDYLLSKSSSRISVEKDKSFEIRVKDKISGKVLEEYKFDKNELKYLRSVIIES